MVADEILNQLVSICLIVISKVKSNRSHLVLVKLLIYLVEAFLFSIQLEVVPAF